MTIVLVMLSGESPNCELALLAHLVEWCVADEVLSGVRRNGVLSS